MKVDVEGHELEVFQAALKTIGDMRPAIVFEFAPSLAQRAGRGLADLAQLISPDSEYAFFLLGEDELRPIDILRPDTGEGTLCVRHPGPTRGLKQSASDQTPKRQPGSVKSGIARRPHEPGPIALPSGCPRFIEGLRTG